MGNLSIHEIVERYIQLTHEVWKRGEALIRDEIGEVLTNDQHYLLRYIYRQKGVHQQNWPLPSLYKKVPLLLLSTGLSKKTNQTYTRCG